MWVGMKGVLDKQAGEADATIPTLRAQNSITASSSRGKREVLVDHSPESWQNPQPTKCFTKHSRKISMRGFQVNVASSERREDRGQTGHSDSSKEENK